MSIDVERLTLTIRETAESLGVTTRSVERWIASGVLPSVRIGGRVLVPLAELEQMVNGEKPAA